MNENILTSIITGIVTIIVTLIAVIFPERRKIKKLKGEIKEKDKQIELQNNRINTLSTNNEIVSTGVAIGYFNNFIKRIFNKLNEGNKVEIKLYQKHETQEQVLDNADRKSYSFNEKEVRFVVVLPADLTPGRLKDADNFEKSKTKALLMGKGEKRHFSFFCDIVNDRELVIYDYPNPFDAVRKFIYMDNRYGYKRDGNVVVDRESETNAPERHKREIENFKSTIIKMSKVDDNVSIVNKIDFKSLS
ncbi:MAG: STING domain-containing protein [Bacteroidota bacterium]